MARNTDIQRILFPVTEKPVFLGGQDKAIPGLKAIAGIVDGKNEVFSVVSVNYRLVTNKEALELGQRIHRQLFPGADSSSFEIFNVIAPGTCSYCHIDIIEKNYTKNIWKQELYVPFIRIHNSYNRSQSLKFDIGFCRKLCDNGVIFEQEVVKLKFSHTRKEIDLGSLVNIDVSHLKRLVDEFVAKTKRAAETKISISLFVPIAARVLKKSFDIESKKPATREREINKMIAFQHWIKTSADKYVHEFGPTAYALFNVLTDYASNHAENHISSINGLQRNAGIWINNLEKITTTPGFSWENETREQRYLLN